MIRDDGPHYYLNNKEVSEKVYREWYPERPVVEDSGPCSLVPFKAMHSEALAVHPRQIKAVMERNRKHGLNTEYDKHGRPRITSKEEFVKLGAIDGLKHFGYS